MRYLVMECHPGYAVLLDEAGRFVRAANLRYEVGQTVCNPVLWRSAKAAVSGTALWLRRGAAAAAACLVLAGGAACYRYFVQPYSSIYLTINPSVQMELNRRGGVVELEGLNADGKALLAGYDRSGKTRLEVADDLVDRALEMGYLADGGQVAIAIDTPDEALFRTYGVELRTEVTQHLTGRAEVDVSVVSGDSAPVIPPAAPAAPAVSESAAPVASASSSPASSAPAAQQPAASQPAPADTDYGPGNDGVTDYAPTPAPAGGDSGYSDYGGSSYGDSGYDD